MSLFRITKNETETISVLTNPIRTFSSSSTLGVTGSVYVYPRRSEIEKEVEPISFFIESAKNDADINEELRAVQAVGNVIRTAGTSSLRAKFPGVVESYLNKVNAQQLTVKKRKVLDISRFIPSYAFTKD